VKVRFTRRAALRAKKVRAEWRKARTLAPELFDEELATLVPVMDPVPLAIPTGDKVLARAIEYCEKQLFSEPAIRFATCPRVSMRFD
jgi:hypothetical protein